MIRSFQLISLSSGLPAVTSKRATILLIATLVVASANAARLPGFRVEKVASAHGFVSSLAISSEGDIYYSNTGGMVYRLSHGLSIEVATIPTANEGNSALLGIAFRGPDELVAHHVLPDLTADIITSVNIRTGVQEMLALFECDNGRPCPSEHHGGNLIVLPDLSVMVGIGDFGGGLVAQMDDSPAGKIYRIRSSEDIERFALGFRNPFDLAYDIANDRVIMADNGPVGEDEVHIVEAGDNCGWPYTVGTQAPVEGMNAPVYTFSRTIAPTGVLLFEGPSPKPSQGLLVGSFVTRAIYYFPDIDQRPLRDPLVLIENEVGPVIDIAQDGEGRLFFATGNGVYRLHLPIAGDANGNGRLEESDILTILREINDGDGSLTIDAAGGEYPGSWGCDVNGDGYIDANDVAVLSKIVSPRRRPVSR
jgi:glucose/arabinose dehydrogenase